MAVGVAINCQQAIRRLHPACLLFDAIAVHIEIDVGCRTRSEFNAVAIQVENDGIDQAAKLVAEGIGERVTHLVNPGIRVTDLVNPWLRRRIEVFLYIVNILSRPDIPLKSTWIKATYFQRLPSEVNTTVCKVMVPEIKSERRWVIAKTFHRVILRLRDVNSDVTPS